MVKEIIGENIYKRTDSTTGRPHRLVDNSSAQMNYFFNDEQHKAHAELVLCDPIPRECKNPLKPSASQLQNERARLLVFMVGGGAMFIHNEGTGITSWKSSASSPPGAM